MKVRILGSAAGGGVPQWNCRCPNCSAARADLATPRTQSSVAVSADGLAWFLLNVSPDVRQQILAFPALGAPESAQRGTGIVGCVLTDAELDHTAGLLLLREGTSFSIYSTASVRRWLNRYLPIEPILSCFCKPQWSDLSLDASLELGRLRIRAFETDRHVPRFVKEQTDAAGSVIGLEVEDTQTGGRLVYAPCVASLQSPLLQAAEGADCILIDGTFWDDEEPIRCGIGSRTARFMGHLPVSAPQGSLEWLGELKTRHRVYIHINNTNPMLNERGPEHRLVSDQGIHVGMDGDSWEF